MGACPSGWTRVFPIRDPPSPNCGPGPGSCVAYKRRRRCGFAVARHASCVIRSTRSTRPPLVRYPNYRSTSRWWCLHLKIPKAHTTRSYPLPATTYLWLWGTWNWAHACPHTPRHPPCRMRGRGGGVAALLWSKQAVRDAVGRVMRGDDCMPHNAHAAHYLAMTT